MPSLPGNGIMGRRAPHGVRSQGVREVLSVFEIGAVLVGLAALFGCMNHRWLRAPPTIGLVLIALAAASVLLLVESALPMAQVDAVIADVLAGIDFHETLMHGMLSFRVRIK